MQPTTQTRWRVAATKGQNERGIIDGQFAGELDFFDMTTLLQEIIDEGVDNYQEIMIQCSEYTVYYDTYDIIRDMVENEDSQQTITLTTDMLRNMY